MAIKENIYIVQVSNPNQKLAFQFMPEGVENSRSANFSGINIIGRNDDILQFNGGSETLNFSIKFYSEKEDRSDVKEKIDWLKSLTIRDGNNSEYQNVILVFGEMFLNYVWVVTNITQRPQMFDESAEYRPIYAECNISLRLDPKTNLLWSDIRSGGLQ